MAYEAFFCDEMAKELASSEGATEEFLDDQMDKLKKRIVTLNKCREKMAQGYSLVLEGLGEAFPELIGDANLEGTPNRVAKALLETCRGLGAKHQEIFSKSFQCDYDGVILLKDIEYSSLCAHHFFPFTGKAHIAYIPKKNNQCDQTTVVGLSKLARIVDCFAKRPQLQERMCSQILESIGEAINPAGAIVLIEGEHGCLTCRGAEKPGAKMVTYRASGDFFKSEGLRSEFFRMIGFQG